MEIICAAISVYFVVLFLRIILSWTTMFWSPPPWASPAVKVIFDLTEPVMKVFRRVIPPLGGLDLSPLIIFFILRAIQGALCRPGF